jgi:pantoate--beta-alanine ligase
MRGFSRQEKLKGKTIGFVPTMGYLHQGHLSLIKTAKKKSDCVIVSIFVNPSQFGPKEDFEKYPRDIVRDKNLLASERIDCLFLPETSEVYKAGFSTWVDVKKLSEKLCGRSRPDHFRGVATIVMKLFNIINPDFAFFGVKDFQQHVIIEKMIEDLNMNVEIISCPTIREEDGLAISSRNKYLNKKERRAALVLFRSLLLAKKEVQKGNKESKTILLKVKKMINSEPLAKTEYFDIVNPETLEKVSIIKNRALVAGAVHIGKTRLIDNILIYKLWNSHDA